MNLGLKLRVREIYPNWFIVERQYANTDSWSMVRTGSSSAIEATVAMNEYAEEYKKHESARLAHLERLRVGKDIVATLEL